jgi:hypothetical protein
MPSLDSLSIAIDIYLTAMSDVEFVAIVWLDISIVVFLVNLITIFLQHLFGSNNEPRILNYLSTSNQQSTNSKIYFQELFQALLFGNFQVTTTIVGVVLINYLVPFVKEHNLCHSIPDLTPEIKSFAVVFLPICVSVIFFLNLALEKG